MKTKTKERIAELEAKVLKLESENLGLQLRVGMLENPPPKPALPSQPYRHWERDPIWQIDPRGTRIGFPYEDQFGGPIITCGTSGLVSGPLVNCDPNRAVFEVCQ